MLHSEKINSWYSSVQFIMNELGITNLQVKSGTLVNTTKKLLLDSFLKNWYEVKSETLKSKTGKLDTYFSIKNCFEREKYLDIKHFKSRQAMCKLRISAHPLRIEYGRYKNIERSERICLYCTQGRIEDEQHFITECNLYQSIRETMYLNLTKTCSNFENMNNVSKFIWLFTNEDSNVLTLLANYIQECLEIRRQHC